MSDLQSLANEERDRWCDCLVLLENLFSTEYVGSKILVLLVAVC